MGICECPGPGSVFSLSSVALCRGLAHSVVSVNLPEQPSEAQLNGSDWALYNQISQVPPTAGVEPQALQSPLLRPEEREDILVASRKAPHALLSPLP